MTMPMVNVRVAYEGTALTRAELGTEFQSTRTPMPTIALY